jgi:hypothetical protein
VSKAQERLGKAWEVVKRPWVIGAVVGALALVGLASTALGAVGSESHLSTDATVRQAQRSDAYYACLSEQAHSLIGPHDVVYLANPTLEEWVTLTKVMGGWAHLTLHEHQANVGIDLQRVDSTGPGSTCDGSALITLRRSPDGHLSLARGRS